MTAPSPAGAKTPTASWRTETFVSRGVPALSPGLSGVRTLGSGSSSHHACAISNTGALSCWGFNPFGILGDGTKTNRATPVDVPGLTAVSQVSCGIQTTCAVSGAGALACWGGSSFGEIGDGTMTDRPAPTPIATDGPVRSIAVGYGHACAALEPAGTVWCWGDNASGQGGEGTTTRHLTPFRVPALTGAVSVGTGVMYTCALLTDGRVLCWGQNVAGQLGDGTSTYRYSPVYVHNVADAVAIGIGGYHACALLADGSVACWGSSEATMGPGRPGTPWRPPVP